jgi:hypothetical protein
MGVGGSVGMSVVYTLPQEDIKCVDIRPMAPKLIDVVAEIILEVVVPAHTFWAATGRVTL